jgi:hypothetical protein
MERYPNSSLWQPELTSLATASGSNKVVVRAFLDVLECLVNENNITVAKILNIDETPRNSFAEP